MFGEFKAFLLKTNALALAVGVIIGAALGNVVNSLVKDIIMPPVGLLLGGVDFSQLKITLQTNADPAKNVAINYGTFINTIISFVIIALIVFWISKMFLRPEPTPETKVCPFCKEANDPAASKCRACTSAI